MTDRKNEPVQLPEPWEDVRLYGTENHKLHAVNSEFREVLEYIEDKNPPKHPFAVGRMGLFEFAKHAEWKLVRNTANGMIVAMLLGTTYSGQPDGIGVNFRLLEMFIVAQPYTEDISTTDLHDFPLKAIISAYLKVRWSREVVVNRAMLLNCPKEAGIPTLYWNDEDVPRACPPKNILTPLPVEYSRRNWFYALVAEQYDAVAEKYPNANAANKMVEINSDVAPGSVRRWITKARKMGLLLPADWKRGDSDAA